MGGSKHLLAGLESLFFLNFIFLALKVFLSKQRSRAGAGKTLGVFSTMQAASDACFRFMKSTPGLDEPISLNSHGEYSSSVNNGQGFISTFVTSSSLQVASPEEEVKQLQSEFDSLPPAEKIRIGGTVSSVAGLNSEQRRAIKSAIDAWKNAKKAAAEAAAAIRWKCCKVCCF